MITRINISDCLLLAHISIIVIMNSKKSQPLRCAIKGWPPNLFGEPNKSLQVDQNTDTNLNPAPRNNQDAPNHILVNNNSHDIKIRRQSRHGGLLYPMPFDPSTSTTTNSINPTCPSSAISPALVEQPKSDVHNNNISSSSSGLSIQQDCPSTSFKSPQIPSSEIKSLFECPICFDYATPPIYQCQNGHLVCQGCSRKITNCPTCRVPISNPSIRNLQLDRLANTFQFPCKYNFNGCQWKSYWFQKREHEDNCDFISYSCPCPGTSCKWTGLLNEVMSHLNDQHRSITTLSGEDIVFLATDINLKGAVDWVMIQSCFNHNFLLVLEKQEHSGQQQFIVLVQLIGPQKDAEQFKYKLELSGGSAGNIMRLQWEAKPHSILDGIQGAILNHDCLAFDARMAKHFLSHIHKDKGNNQGNNVYPEGPGENLGINVTIEKLNNVIPMK